MKKAYQYIDPDYVYTNQATGVLRNKAGIDDAKLLLNFESLQRNKTYGRAVIKAY